MREAAQLADLRIVHMGDRQRQHALDMESEVNGQGAGNAEVNSNSSMAPSNPEYEVELILDKRMVEGVAEYLVMWRGWPDGTWEPVENLKGSERLVKKFEKLQKSANGQMTNGSTGEKRGRDRSEDRKRVKKFRETSEESETSENGSTKSKESESSGNESTESKEAEAKENGSTESEEDLTRKEAVSDNCEDTQDRDERENKKDSIQENGQELETPKADKVSTKEIEKDNDDIARTDKKKEEGDPEKEKKEEDDEEEGEEEEWEVEKVLKKRKIGGETQYFVKWVGWEEVAIYIFLYS